MESVRGCVFPKELLYHIDHNIWLRKEEDGSIVIGMTAYALALSGQLIYYTPKKVGKTVKKDRSCTTVESGKWVGPVKSPIAGEIIGTNDALRQEPGLINSDPYGQGWLVRLLPFDWEADCSELLTGDDAVEAFHRKMEAEGFDGCF